MEEKYGSKVTTLKTQGMIYLPTVMATVLFAIVFFSILATGSGSETGPSVIGLVVSGICFVIAGGLLLRQIIAVHLDVFDKHLVQNNLFGKKVYAAEELRAIIWQFPGLNPLNPRGARINNTSAELVFRDGRKSIKFQDSFYQNMEKEISAFQRRNNIPADLELEKKKGAHRYD